MHRLELAASRLPPSSPIDAGGLTLKAFAQQPLGLPGAQDAVREGALKKALATLLSDPAFASKKINLCPWLSGLFQIQ